MRKKHKNWRLIRTN